MFRKPTPLSSDENTRLWMMVFT